MSQRTRFAKSSITKHEPVTKPVVQQLPAAEKPAAVIPAKPVIEPVAISEPVIEPVKHEEPASESIVVPEPTAELIIPQPVTETLKNVIVDDIRFISAVMSGEVVAAEAELTRLNNDHPLYISQSNIIVRICEDLKNLNLTDNFKHAVATIAAEIDINNSASVIDKIAPILYQSLQESKFKALRWLLTYDFPVDNSVVIIIENFMKIPFIEPDSPNKPRSINIDEFNSSQMYHDIFHALMRKSSLSVIPDSIYINLANYQPYITEVLLQQGMEVDQLVAGKPIAWHIMRSAVKYTSFRDRTSLGQIFLTKLQNSGSFTYKPQYFTECGDHAVFSQLMTKAEFKAHITDPLDDGSLFISTISDDRFISQLITAGSPLPSGEVFTPNLADKQPLLQSLYARDPSKFNSRHSSEDLTLFSFYLANGKITTGILATLEYLATVTPNAFEVVYNNPSFKTAYFSWTPLHLFWHRWSYSFNNENREAFFKIANFLYTNAFNKIDNVFDNSNRIPLMCITFPSDEEERKVYDALIAKYAEVEAKLLQKNKKNINASTIVRYITAWMPQEADARKKDAIVRSKFVNIRLMKPTPWES